MKRTLQRTLAAEKRKIERRLRNAVTVNDSGPVLSAPNLRYELAAKTKAIAAGGIGAIHRLVQHIGLAACIDACAGKARSRGTRCRDVIFETLFEPLWVSNPIRPRSAASRNRVMRGPGVTQGAKRSQGARRPRD